MEMIKDSDILILHHSGKANVVADTLRRKLLRMESLVRLKYQGTLFKESYSLWLMVFEIAGT